MKFQLNKVRTSSGGGESRSSTEIESASVTIGRDASQHIHVPDMQVALQHARIVPSPRGGLQLEVLSANGMVVNDRRVQACRLGTGDQIRLGATHITVCEGPAGFDLALEVRRIKSGSDQTTRLHHGAVLGSGAAIRFMSWLLFLVVLAIGMGLPLASHFRAIAGQQQPHTLPVLKMSAANIWLPGPLATSHEYFGHDCTSCHKQPFRPVDDEDCKSCHNDVALHLPETIAGVTDPAAHACESCHLEHNGANQLITSSQGFCADCHSDTARFAGQDSQSPAATDFASDHPSFRVDLQRSLDDGSLELTRVALTEDSAFESSNLLFPHDVHLVPEGVDAPQGNVVMQCQDCHQPVEGGELMVPIDFEAHCADCHLLDFDLSAPGREVPHGDPNAALSVISEFYAELALRGSSEEVDIETLAMMPPDQSLHWARQQAETAAVALFEERACVQCHELSRSETSQVLQWSVPPVYVKQKWFPAANFTHDRHQLSACEDCHSAADSTSSDDILMPDIESCQTCHGGEDSAGAVASTCISCHDFHGRQVHAKPTVRQPVSGSLARRDRVDLEKAGRSERGVDERRRRPGEGG